MFNRESKIRIYVKDLLHRNDEVELKKEFSELHNVPYSNITIISNSGNISNEVKAIINKSENVASEDISDIYQAYLKDKDYDKILFQKIDKNISLELDFIFNERKNYNLKYISGYNLTSYGHFTLNLDEYYGTNSLTSNPSNFGGKSNLYNLFQILLWGKYLSLDEYSNLIDLFNDYIDDNRAYIEGSIELNEKNYFIRREFVKETKKRVKHNHFIYEITTQKSADKYIYVYDEVLKEIDVKKYNRSLPDGMWVKLLNKDDLKKFQDSIGKIEDFVKICLFNQNTIYSLLSTGRTERTRNFYKMFGGEYYEMKKELANKQYLKFKKSSTLHSMNVNDLQSQLYNKKEELKNVENEILIITQEIDQQKKAIALLESEREALYSSLYNISNDVDLNQLEREQLLLREIIDSTKTEILKSKEKLSSLSIKNDSLTELKTEHSRLIKELNDVTEPKNLINEKNEIEVNIISLKQELSDIKNKLELLSSRKKEIKSEFSKNNDIINILKKQLNEVESDIQCQNCGTIVISYDNKKITLSEQIEQLRSTNSQLKIEANDLVKSEDNLINKEQILVKNLDAVEIKKVEIDSNIKKQIEESKLNINEKLEDNLKLQNETEFFIKLTDDINSKENKNRENIESLKKIEEKIKSFDKEYQIKLEKNKQTKEKIEQINIKIKDTNEIHAFSLEKKGNLLATKNNFNEFIEECNEKISSFQDEIALDKAYLFYIQTHDMNGIVKFMIESYLPLINRELDALTEHMNFKINIFLDKGKYIDYKFIRDDKNRNLKKVSGCERFVGLAAIYLIYIKFSKVNLPNIVLFDEVFDQVATENIENIYEILKLYNEVFDHVFFISHGRELEDYTDNNITITKEKNISKIIEI